MTTKSKKTQWNVRCWNCGWSGVRYSKECDCSIEWCAPGTPGSSCASSVIHPCPKCGPDIYSERTERIRHTSILSMGPVKKTKIIENKIAA
jgi:predicted RNA-binding Zn-ribbon protein involved in translation (DUF1610 family)